MLAFIVHAMEKLHQLELVVFVIGHLTLKHRQLTSIQALEHINEVLHLSVRKVSQESSPGLLIRTLQTLSTINASLIDIWDGKLMF